jgi:hypothetical protein
MKLVPVFHLIPQARKCRLAKSSLTAEALTEAAKKKTGLSRELPLDC